MLFYAKFFLFSLLFPLFIIFPLKSYADSYYFQDEFNTTLSPNTLDPTKWTVFPNNRPSFNTVSTDGNSLSTTQENNTYRYPLIISKNAIPQGDFSFEIKFQYTNVTMWGTGFNLSENKPLDDGSYTSNFNIGVWQDKYLSNMRVHVNDVDVYSIPNNTNPHVLLIEKSNSKYKIFLDRNLIYTATNISVNLDYLWLGNPLILNSPVPSWTKFKVDYIRVKSLSPQPFLDLPWGYSKDGKSFDDQALNPYSWFDHQYPLQNMPYYPPVMNYTGKTINSFYRSHNGYDYNYSNNGVRLNTPVLAAASGNATFKPWQRTGGAGNVIKINHGNGYQTWYEHLDKDDLVVSTEEASVYVNKGQQIGKVGMTGNTTGPHIHFSVFANSNNNNTFDDDIPYGVTDPLGWEGTEPDPWTIWNSGGRRGAPSYKLFTGLTPPQEAIVPVTGGTVSNGTANVQIPPSAHTQTINLNLKKGPFESISTTITSIVPSIYIAAVNMLGQSVNSFLQPITINYNYSGADMRNINEDSINFYYFNLQTNLWEQLPTILDKVNKIAQTNTNHLSQFGLMGTLKDTTPPTTQITINGQKGKDKWYRSPVSVELSGQDNEDGLGVLYTLYSLDGENWYEYTTPLTFDADGTYKTYYQSFDKADNTETRKTIEFNIDKTAPQVTLSASPTLIWPPNGKMVDIKVSGSASDNNYYTNIFSVEDEYGLINPTLTDFGQIIKLESKRDGKDLDGRIYKINLSASDLAGNLATASATILVPHDQR